MFLLALCAFRPSYAVAVAGNALSPAGYSTHGAGPSGLSAEGGLVTLR